MRGGAPLCLVSPFPGNDLMHSERAGASGHVQTVGRGLLPGGEASCRMCLPLTFLLLPQASGQTALCVSQQPNPRSLHHLLAASGLTIRAANLQLLLG